MTLGLLVLLMISATLANCADVTFMVYDMPKEVTAGDNVTIRVELGNQRPEEVKGIVRVALSGYGTFRVLTDEGVSLSPNSVNMFKVKFTIPEDLVPGYYRLRVYFMGGDFNRTLSSEVLVAPSVKDLAELSIRLSKLDSVINEVARVLSEDPEVQEMLHERDSTAESFKELVNLVLSKRNASRALSLYESVKMSINNLENKVNEVYDIKLVLWSMSEEVDASLRLSKGVSVEFWAKVLSASVWILIILLIMFPLYSTGYMSLALALASEIREGVEEEALIDEIKEKSSSMLVRAFNEMREVSTTRAMIMIALAGALASVGLMADNITAIIGSMLLSPLMSAFVASAIGLALIDVEESVSGLDLFYGGLKNGIIGTAMVIGLSWLTALLAKAFVPLQMTSQLAARSSPNMSDLVIALGAGFAGSVAMLHEKGESALVGSAIAIALVPPASAVGVGLAMGSPSVTVGSFSLLTVNIISLITAGYISARIYALVPIVRLVFEGINPPEGDSILERVVRFLGDVLIKASEVSLAWLKVAFLGIYFKATGFVESLKALISRIYHIATPIVLSLALGALISTDVSLAFSLPFWPLVRLADAINSVIKLKPLLGPYWNEFVFLLLATTSLLSFRHLYYEVPKARDGSRRSLARVITYAFVLWMSSGYLLGAHKFPRVAAVLFLIMFSALLVTTNKRLWENRKKVALLGFIVLVLLTITIHSAMAFEKARIYETIKSKGFRDLVRGIVASYAGLRINEVQVNVTVQEGKWIVLAQILVPESRFKGDVVMTSEVVKAAEMTIRRAVGEDVVLRVHYVIIPS